VRIIHYPHPTLRYRSKPIRRINEGIRQLARRMFDLMYEAKGIGLAANQVNVPLRLFVVNLAGKPDEGEEWVFVNPVISQPQGWQEEEEGCLSLPGLYAPVGRPRRVVIQAFDLQGNEIVEDVSGWMARVVQHELDHLDGVLFIDRVQSAEHRGRMQETLAALEAKFREERAAGLLPPENVIAQGLQAWIAQYA
jgi:peptide deformylase